MAVHIIALPTDPEAVEVQYEEGVTTITYNACSFSINNVPKVGTLQLKLLAADVGALTHEIGRAIAEETERRRKLEP